MIDDLINANEIYKNSYDSHIQRAYIHNPRAYAFSQDHNDVSYTEEIAGNYKKLEQLIARLEYMETTTHAYWTLFMESGLTPEDINKTIPDALKKEKNKVNRKQTTACKKCRRQISKTDVLETKCIYCGHKSIGNPYEEVIDEEKSI